MQSTYDPQQKHKQFGPVKDEFFLVRWLNLHTFAQLFWVVLRPLGVHDLFNTRQDVKPEYVYKQYLNHHLRNPVTSTPNTKPLISLKQLTDVFSDVDLEIAKFQLLVFFFFPQFVITCNVGTTNLQTHSLRKSLFLLFLWEILLAGFLSILSTAITFVGPYFIKQVLNFVNDPTASIQTSSTLVRSLLLWFLLYLLKIFIDEYYQRMCTILSIKAQHIITLSVYDKMMKVSYAYWRKLQLGDVYMLLVTDGGFVINLMKMITVFFSAPAGVLFAQIVVLREAGLTGWTLAFIILVFIFVQVFLVIKLARLSLEKFSYYEHRLILNSEIYSSLKQLRQLGWDELLINKNRQLRPLQNKLNRDYAIWECIYNFLINFYPAFVVLFVFLAESINLGQSRLNTVEIYVILVYVFIAGLNVGALPSAIVQLVQAKVGTRRLQHFLDAQQCHLLSDEKLSPGEIIIQNLSANWETQETREHFKNPNRGYINKTISTTETRSSSNKIVSVDDKQHSVDQVQDFSQSHMEFTNDHQLRVHRSIRICPGDKIAVVSDGVSDKSAIIQLLLGHLHIEEGSVSYNGRLAFMCSKPFLTRTTVQENILFGQSLEEARLDKVYDMVFLSDELAGFEKYDLADMSEQMLDMNNSTKKRICLARAIYSGADILLLQDPFEDSSNDEARAVHFNIRNQLKQKTVLFTTSRLSIIDSDTKVIVIKSGEVVEFDTVQKLLSDPNSQLSLIKNEQTIGKAQSISVLNNKSAEYRKQIKPIQPEAPAPVRVARCPRTYYLEFLQGGGPWLYLVLVLLWGISQACQATSIWWTGAKLPNFTPQQTLIIYISLVIGYGVFLLVAGILLAYISVGNVQHLSDIYQSRLLRTSLHWAQATSKYFMLFVLSPDHKNLFFLNSLWQGVFYSVSGFIVTVVLTCYVTPIYLILILIVIALNALFLYAFQMAERQMFDIGFLLIRDYLAHLSDCILGSTVVRAYRKESHMRNILYDKLYGFVAAYNMSYRFIAHGLSLLSNLTGLALIAGSVGIALSHKSTSSDSLAILGALIVLANSTTGNFSGIVSYVANIEIFTKIFVYVPHLFSGVLIQDVESSSASKEWPYSGEICFENVNFADSGATQQERFSMTIKQGEKVVLKETGFGRLRKLIFNLTCRSQWLSKSSKNNEGRILIGGEDISKLSRKGLRNQVMAISGCPLIFTGTIRQNLDPFGQHDDSQLEDVLTKVRLWEELPKNSHGQLQLEIRATEDSLTLSQRQKLNFARVLLKKPKFLIIDNCVSGLTPAQRRVVQGLIFSQLRESTVLIGSIEPHTYLQCDRVLTLEGEQLAEQTRQKMMMQDGILGKEE